MTQGSQTYEKNCGPFVNSAGSEHFLLSKKKAIFIFQIRKSMNLKIFKLIILLPLSLFFVCCENNYMGEDLYYSNRTLHLKESFSKQFKNVATTMSDTLISRTEMILRDSGKNFTNNPEIQVPYPLYWIRKTDSKLLKYMVVAKKIPLSNNYDSYLMQLDDNLFRDYYFVNLSNNKVLSMVYAGSWSCSHDSESYDYTFTVKSEDTLYLYTRAYSICDIVGLDSGEIKSIQQNYKLINESEMVPPFLLLKYKVNEKGKIVAIEREKQ